MKTYPKNPRLPVPTFEIAHMPEYTAYGWKCDKHGIMVFGNSMIEAQELWAKAYHREYFS